LTSLAVGAPLYAFRVRISNRTNTTVDAGAYEKRNNERARVSAAGRAPPAYRGVARARRVGTLS